MMVREYYSYFMELLQFAPNIAGTQEVRTAKFEAGLTLDLQKALRHKDFNTIQ